MITWREIAYKGRLLLMYFKIGARRQNKGFFVILQQNIKRMNKVTFFCIFSAMMLSSCQESIENRAAKEAREYTEKYCPTPTVNYTRTDSVTFDRTTRTYHYYCTLSDRMDNRDIIDKNRKMLHDSLLQAIVESTHLQAYKEAGFNFTYTCRSAAHPRMVLYEDTFTPKEYNVIAGNGKAG